MPNQNISAARTSDRAALMFRLEELEKLEELEELEEWAERGSKRSGQC